MAGENFTYGSVGRAPGNRCLYPELEEKHTADTYGVYRSCTIHGENDRQGTIGHGLPMLKCGMP